MTTSQGDPFPAFYERLEARHLADLTFAEVRRALQALSSLYVERRDRMRGGGAFEGRGKRAAFALYYGPLHFLVVREVVRALGPPLRTPPRLLDLGCGTGTAAAAWAMECHPAPAVEGVDLAGWAVTETRWSLDQLGLRGRARRGDAAEAVLPRPPAGIVAAFTLNELDQAGRTRLLPRLLKAAAGGTALLVLEPLSRRVSPWWPEWAGAVKAAGGREDEWHFPAPGLPKTLALLGKASTLDNRQLTARSLSLGFAGAGWSATTHRTSSDTGAAWDAVTGGSVPEISRFYGIVVTMFYSDHEPPHFHVRYSGHKAIVAIDDFVVLRGALPPRALALVKEWAGLHVGELEENWRRARENEVLRPIHPLE